MKVGALQKRDISYAMAILPIITHKHRQEVEIRPRGKSYLVFFDDNRRLLIVKRGKTVRARVGLTWYFNVHSNEMECLNQAMHDAQKVYFHLVCGNSAVCALEGKEAIELMDTRRTLRVHRRDGMYTVTGSTDKPITKRQSKDRDFLNYFFRG